jgi:hypothetical protein
MYRKTLLIMTVLICATTLLALFLHEQAHRYDIVAVGAGAGGSNGEKGDVSTEEFLIDHKTGEVYVVSDPLLIQLKRIELKDYPPKKVGQSIPKRLL